MNKRQEANKIIRDHTLWSMGAGLLPIPLLDLAAITAVQIDMLNLLSDLYEVEESQRSIKTFVSALTGTVFAQLGASLLKSFAGIGSLIGGFSLVIMAGASTYAIGQVAIDIFEEGGTLGEADMNAAKKAYTQALEEGKKVASDLKKRQEAQEADAEQETDEEEPVAQETNEEEPVPSEAPATKESSSPNTLLASLERLASLKNRGIVSEEEFVKMKQKIMAQL